MARRKEKKESEREKEKKEEGGEEGGGGREDKTTSPNSPESLAVERGVEGGGEVPHGRGEVRLVETLQQLVCLLLGDGLHPLGHLPGGACTCSSESVCLPDTEPINHNYAQAVKLDITTLSLEAIPQTSA